MQLRKEPEKTQDFEGIWTRDLGYKLISQPTYSNAVSFPWGSVRHLQGAF